MIKVRFKEYGNCHPLLMRGAARSPWKGQEYRDRKILVCFYSLLQLYVFVYELTPVELSWVQFFVTLWTLAQQGPLPMEFSKQEYWSGLPWPRDRTQVSRTAGRFFIIWATREALCKVSTFTNDSTCKEWGALELVSTVPENRVFLSFLVIYDCSHKI